MRDARTFQFVSQVAETHSISQRQSLSLTTEESRFLSRCATQANWTPDYSCTAIIPEAFFAFLEDVNILGNSGAITCKHGVLVDSMLHLKKLTRSAAYRTRFPRRTKEIQGLATSIFYLPEARSNVYHWLVECLPRLWLLDQATDEPVALVCHADMSDYQLASLKPFLDKRPNWKVQKISANERFSAKQYLFVSFLCGLNSGLMNSAALEFVRSTLHTIAADGKGPKKIYVSRKNASVRGLDQEQEVAAELEKRGFVVVRPEFHSLSEQVRMFRDAEVVVGAHGAGLANLIFSKASHLIELHPSNFCKPHYLLLARGCGHSYTKVLGGPLNEQGTFSIDTKAILAAMDEWDGAR